MPHSSKIVTCCYCGSRAALILRGKVRHELACSNCGAPLHELKMLRIDAGGDRELVRPSPIRLGNTRPARRKKTKKRSRSLSQRFMAELKDAAEDVFDDLFDIFD
ncbi:MAG: hypothetical protein KJO42_16150 [Silicimonas sp.]|nr:hypothetical protein [Silicimonas sp.]